MWRLKIYSRKWQKTVENLSKRSSYYKMIFKRKMSVTLRWRRRAAGSCRADGGI